MVLTYTSQDRLRLELATTEAPPPLGVVRDERRAAALWSVPAWTFSAPAGLSSNLFRVGQCTVALSSIGAARDLCPKLHVQESQPAASCSSSALSAPPAKVYFEKGVQLQL